MTRRYVQEAAKLGARRSNGTYPVVVITEGVGSSGVYSGELLENSVEIFENAPSFINHPIDPEKPHERDLNTLAGRLSNLTVGEDAGKKALLADYKPRKEYESLFEEFGDIIGLSIFCGAYGEKDENDRVVVESFDGADPYRSVDAVVAAGRGGRFKRAQESLRAIESSLGSPEGTKPDAASAQESINQEVHMEQKDLDAIAAIVVEALAPVNTFFANEETRRQAEADAAANNNDVSEAVEAAVAAVEAVKAAKVLPSLEAKLVESAKRGEDVTKDLEFAKTVTAEAAGPAKGAPAGTSYVHESAPSGDDEDFSFNFGGSR